MRILMALLLALCCASLGAQPKALFYLNDSALSLKSFYAHSTKIDILVPTWYSVDENGLVSGAPNPSVIAEAHKQGITVMPLVALFGKAKVHALATSATAQIRMNAAMIRESRLYGYSGMQFDLENVDYLDRDDLSALVARSAQALHETGLQISIATVPNAPGYPGKSGFSKWIFTDWRGAYDLAALAKSVDLLCVMTYDQHTLWTAPGPVAGWQWTLDNLDYALKVVPKEKLSLGIPVYGYHWFAGTPTVDKATGDDKPSTGSEYISSETAEMLVTNYGGKLQWDEADRTAFAYFYRDQMREWVFVTDQQTFRERYQLVKARGIEGFCSWLLGEEDPAIWNELPEHVAKK